MKKIFLLLAFVSAAMGIDAQVVKIYNGSTLVKTYTNSATDDYIVTFDKASDGTKSMTVLNGTVTVATYTDTDADKYEAVFAETPLTSPAKSTGTYSRDWVRLSADGPLWSVSNAKSSTPDGKGTLDNWGSNNDSSSKVVSKWDSYFDLPTTDELNALMKLPVKFCKYPGTDNYGFFFYGKGDYKANSIFIPATSTYTDEDGTEYSTCLWTKEIDSFNEHVNFLYLSCVNGKISWKMFNGYPSSYRNYFRPVVREDLVSTAIQQAK